MLCNIWYHLYNLKNMKNTHGGVLFLVKLQAEKQLKVTLVHGCFSRFLKCTNGTELCNASHMSNPIKTSKISRPQYGLSFITFFQKINQ